MKKILLFGIGVAVLGLSGCGKEGPRPIDYSKQGTKYLLGVGGVSKNMTKALMLHGKACGQGYALSCGTLGWIYEDDTEVTAEIKQNLPLSVQWYEKACKMGEKSACTGLARVQSLMAGDPCQTSINSLKKHVVYIKKHNSHRPSKEVCKHINEAIRDSKIIRKTCSQDIRDARQVSKDEQKIVRTFGYSGYNKCSHEQMYAYVP